MKSTVSFLEKSTQRHASEKGNGKLTYQKSEKITVNSYVRNTKANESNPEKQAENSVEKSDVGHSQSVQDTVQCSV